jgi:hypothetical protein
LYDIEVQNGGLDENDKAKIRNMIPVGASESDIQKIIADYVVSLCVTAYQGDVMRRKYAIIEGKGTVHGEERDFAKEYGLGDTIIPF